VIISQPVITGQSPFPMEVTRCGMNSLSDNAALPPATEIFTQPGFTVGYFIPPSGLNVPSDVVVLPGDEILVTSSRSGKVQLVSSEGELRLFAEAGAYSMGADGAGNLYGYFFPNGDVFQIMRGKKPERIAHVLATACESTLAVAPDSTIYLGVNFCGGNNDSHSAIFRILPGHEPVELLNTGSQMIPSLDVDDSGRLFAVINDHLTEISTQDGRYRELAQIPEWPSFHGLVMTEDGGAYVSTGDFSDHGSLYHISISGNVEKIAQFVNNGLEGLALKSDGTVIGTQRSIGGLQAIHSDGQVEALIAPNGLVSPHSLAISTCGELLTVNDEAGRLTLAYPDGTNIPYTPLISFQPPQTHIAFSKEGWFVAGESAPGFPSLVNQYEKTKKTRSLAEDLAWVSGVAVGEDSEVYVSATGDGKIYRLGSDGSKREVISGLHYPQALALAADGTLYAITGGQGFGDVFSIPAVGDTLISIGANGEMSHQDLPGISTLAIGPDGRIFAAAGDKIWVLQDMEKPEVFATGFQSIRGLAFDLAGRLYAADDQENAIYRLQPEILVYVQGLVVDTYGNPLADAAIQVIQTDPPYAGALAITDTNGFFSLPVAFTAKLSVEKNGYQSVTIEVSSPAQPVKIVLLEE